MITVYSTTLNTILAMVVMDVTAAKRSPSVPVITGSVRRLSDGEKLLGFEYGPYHNGCALTFKSAPAWKEYSRLAPQETCWFAQSISVHGLQRSVLADVVKRVKSSRKFASEEFVAWLGDDTTAICDNTDLMYMEIESVEMPEGNDADESREFMESVREYCVALSKCIRKFRRVMARELPPMFKNWDEAKVMDVSVITRKGGVLQAKTSVWSISLTPTQDGMDYCIRAAYENSEIMRGHIAAGATLADLLTDMNWNYDGVLIGMMVDVIFQLPSGKAIRPTSIESY